MINAWEIAVFNALEHEVDYHIREEWWLLGC
jgi:hypothetical protein